MTIRDLIRRIERDRWHLVRESDRIRQYHHPFKDGKITIGGDSHVEATASVAKGVFAKAGLDEAEI